MVWTSKIVEYILCGARIAHHLQRLNGQTAYITDAAFHLQQNTEYYYSTAVKGMLRSFYRTLTIVSLSERKAIISLSILSPLHPRPPLLGLL